MTDPRAAIAGRILSAEAALLAASQIALAVAVVRRLPSMRLDRALAPAIVTGLVVAAGDVVGLSFAFHTPATSLIFPVVAYDVVLGVVLALPIVTIVRAWCRCRDAVRAEDVDASPEALISSYRDVLSCSEGRAVPWRWCNVLAHQLLRRHVRRTLEAVQRRYATIAVERNLDELENRGRRTMDDYLLSVAPVSKVVPIPTAATVFVLWKLVPTLVAIAAAGAAWLGGGGWSIDEVSRPIADVVPHEIATLAIDALALVAAFLLLMLCLAPAIRLRDRLLAAHEVCEREVILMEKLDVPRRSRRVEYVMAGLPALPLAAYGGAVLVYALAGLWVYPTPAGPLHGLVERGDRMGVGPVAGAVLAQAFLFVAAAWVAWILKARKTTRVVLV